LLNDKSNLTFSLGLTTNQQEFNSSIFQHLDSENQQPFNSPDFTNKVDYHFQDLYFGVRYKILTGIFTIAPSLSLHRYHKKILQQVTTSEATQYLLLLYFYTSLQFTETNRLKLSNCMFA